MNRRRSLGGWLSFVDTVEQGTPFTTHPTRSVSERPVMDSTPYHGTVSTTGRPWKDLDSSDSERDVLSFDLGRFAPAPAAAPPSPRAACLSRLRYPSREGPAPEPLLLARGGSAQTPDLRASSPCLSVPFATPAAERMPLITADAYAAVDAKAAERAAKAASSSCGWCRRCRCCCCRCCRCLSCSSSDVTTRSWTRASRNSAIRSTARETTSICWVFFGGGGETPNEREPGKGVVVIQAEPQKSVCAATKLGRNTRSSLTPQKL